MAENLNDKKRKSLKKIINNAAESVRDFAKSRPNRGIMRGASDVAMPATGPMNSGIGNTSPMGANDRLRQAVRGAGAPSSSMSASQMTPPNNISMGTNKKKMNKRGM